MFQQRCLILALRQERNDLATNQKIGDGIDDPDRNQLALVADRLNIADVITKSVADPEHPLTIALNIHPVVSMREVDQPLPLIDPSHRNDIDHTNAVHMNEEEDVPHHQNHHQHRRIPNIHRRPLLK